MVLFLVVSLALKVRGRGSCGVGQLVVGGIMAMAVEGSVARGGGGGVLLEFRLISE